MGKLSSPFLRDDRRRTSCQRLIAIAPTLRETSVTTTEAYRSAYDCGSDGPLPLMPPEVRDMTTARGSIPLSSTSPFLVHGPFGESLPAGLPRGEASDLEPYLFGQFSGGKLPYVYEGGESVEVGESEDEVRHALTRCFSTGGSFWTTCLVPQIEHPPWWPQGELVHNVEAYSTLIVGVGSSGIGMHRDGHADRFVSTYLTLGCGRKHVVLLPPTEEGARLAKQLGGRDIGADRAASVPTFPARPRPEMLEAVLAAGGFWFDVAAEAASGQTLTLFIPGGWWHWLEGASEWHVAWGGSFYSPACVAGDWNADEIE